ncbi:MAG: UbiA family prenyltransferase [Deltaproteobacteria bacterium]|nr:UbiA family prenyltransferase [Deltaproteobacteria bacterium]
MKPSKLRAWITAQRFFVLPLLLSFTFFGASLAGLDPGAWATAMLVTGSVWISSHNVNNWRDFVRGVDRVRGGSVAKSYTAANQILPRGLLSVRTVKLTAAGWVALSLAALACLAPLRPDTLALYCLGLATALTYTDLWKPAGLGPACAFVAFFALVSFSYSVARPFDSTAAGAGALAGMLWFHALLLDQLPDVRGPVRRAKDLAEMAFKAELRPSSIFWFGVTAVYVMQTGFVLLGWLPSGTLLSVLSLPLAHVAGIALDFDFQRGMLVGIVWMNGFALLAGAGGMLV